MAAMANVRPSHLLDPVLREMTAFTATAQEDPASFFTSADGGQMKLTGRILYLGSEAQDLSAACGSDNRTTQRLPLRCQYGRHDLWAGVYSRLHH